MVSPRKLWALDDLVGQLDALRRSNRRIVHCHGVFDLFHVGHLRHFRQAKGYGDILVVTLTPDCFVNKGNGRPAFRQELRAEVIASLDCVDFVSINRWPDAVPTIELLRPHVFAKGSEFKSGKDTTGHILREQEAIERCGGEMRFTEDITFTSSGLINQYLSTYSDEVQEYLADFAGRHSADDVLQPLKESTPLKAILVGEAIIDEYQSCEVIGKSGKEAVLASRYLTSSRSAGGVLACANHLASFLDEVTLVTSLGEGGDQEEFVRGHLKENVRPVFLEKANSPTIVKSRFVESYLSQKLFEVYHMNDDPLSAAEEAELMALLDEELPQQDLVLVTDYGHGMLGPKVVEQLCDLSNFLVVNTQSNAANTGFNLISKYPRADYVCLAHREFALETRDRRLPPELMVQHVSEALNCPRVMLTQGKYGSLTYVEGEGFMRVPALATHVVDRVGAGDAVFCLTALCMKQGTTSEVAGFIGNVVGAEAVRILGNERFIERIPLFRQVECLMKLHRARREADRIQETVPFAA